MAFILVLLPILFLAITLKIIFHHHYRRSRRHPVGGTILDHLINFSTLHDYMTNHAAKYKSYRIIGLFITEVYTSEPANVEYMLKTNFQNYGKGRYHYTILNDLLGDGIFTVDGEKWRQQRKVSSHEFSAKAIRDVSRLIFRENALKLANIVSHLVNSDQPMDIQDLFMKSALDSIFKVAFGVELDTVSGSNEESLRFTRAFDDASAISVWRYVDTLWKIKKAFNIGLEAKLKDDLRIVDDFIYKVIDSKTAQLKRSRDIDCRQFDSTKQDILTRFLGSTGADPKYLRDIILNFIMAGKDTTATTLSWFFYMLCKHPLIQEKVAREINKATASCGLVANASVSDFADSLSEEALDKMHYLHAALNETLRLYPPVPVDPKMCFSDDTMPDGFRVKKGDSVAYQPYAMGRMKFLWGDDAEEYKPERWIDENGCFKHESPFKFTAFQAGPRICLGKEFAYRQMKILSAVLLRCFVFKLSDESKVVKYRTMINLHIDGGLSLRAFDRVGSASYII